jgi:hypothetical protein
MSARRRAGTLALLAAILLLGGWLRVRGLGFGLPLDLRPDEVRYQQRCLGFARTGDFNPHQFAYPGLAFYLPYGWARALHAAESLARPEPERRSFEAFLVDRTSARLSQRSLSAACGVATLLVLFLLGRSVHSTGAGLIAAALLAVAFLPVRDSHFGTVDAPTTLAVTVALLAIVAAARSGRLAAFALAGALGGIAAALRYFPIVLALPLLLAVARARHGEHRSLAGALVDPRLLAAALAFLGAFLAGAPYTVLAFDEFREGVRYQTEASLGESVSPLRVAAGILADTIPIAVGAPVALAALAGVVVAAARRAFAPALAAVFALAWIAGISTLSVQFARYVLPATPAICLLAAIAVLAAVELFARLPRAKALAAAALVAALGAAPLLRSLAIDRLFARESTFEVLRREAGELLPEGSVVSSLHPRLAHVLDAPEFAPWDPVEWARAGRVQLLLARHPHASLGDDWAPFREAMLADPRCRELLVVRAASGERWPDARFEPRDLFYYPLDRFDRVDRGGPDFALLEIDLRAPPPPRAPLSRPWLASRFVRGVVELTLAPASSELAFAWRVRAHPVDGGAGDVERCVPSSGATTRVPLDLAAGRWEVVAAGVDFLGVGAWSEPATVDAK